LLSGQAAAARRAAEDAASVPKPIVLATGRYLGEGFHDTSFDGLLLTMPISCKGKARPVCRPPASRASHQARGRRLWLRRFRRRDAGAHGAEASGRVSQPWIRDYGNDTAELSRLIRLFAAELGSNWLHRAR